MLRPSAQAVDPGGESAEADPAVQPSCGTGITRHGADPGHVRLPFIQEKDAQRFVHIRGCLGAKSEILAKIDESAGRDHVSTEEMGQYDIDHLMRAMSRSGQRADRSRRGLVMAAPVRSSAPPQAVRRSGAESGTSRMPIK